MIFNLNVGILGHVDSGKTTLARALSSISSTAAFDKHPQSKERGITLDLGFSALVMDDIPDHLQSETNATKIQYTFVDCPGHASLIRTIIGGAQIIDIMMLVIDVNKGIQTQTAECLVIGEITCKDLLVVINKIDTIPIQDFDVVTKKMKLKIEKVLQKTSFKNHYSINFVSAINGDNISKLVQSLQEKALMPSRKTEEPFLFSVDHCFAMKGQGTVCTGTILQGKISVGDNVEIPITKEIRKVKSMQMFHKPVQSAHQGDRIGLCMTQFNANLMERGILAAAGIVSNKAAVIISFHRIKYFQNIIKSDSKFHISIGHETVMGKITLFHNSKSENFSSTDEYEFLEELPADSNNTNIFALIEFEAPLLTVPNTLVIGCKLDMDIHTNSCRIAFYGKTIWSTETNNLSNLKVFKRKQKQGNVQRFVNKHELIVNNIFKKETKKDLFIGKNVVLSTGEQGIIESTFGQSTKLKVRFSSELNEDTINILRNKCSDVKVLLKFKKYMFNKDKLITQ